MTESKFPPRPLGKLDPLLISQGLGAFNDNAFKMIVALLAMGAAETALRAAAGGDAVDIGVLETARQWETTKAFVIFTLPLMLVSLPACALADSLSKRNLIVALKVFEIGLMALGAWLLFADEVAMGGLLTVLALMGVQSALFSPAKYGILPELLPHERLSEGNGVLEMWTFVAIIAGTAAGAPLIAMSDSSPGPAGVVLAGLAVVGFLAARGLARVPPAVEVGKSRGMTAAVSGAWRVLRRDRVLWLSMLGLTFFWGTASLLGQDVLVYTQGIIDSNGSSDWLASVPLAVLGLGTGLGSFAAGKLSGGKVEFGLIPLGAIGMASACLALGVLGPGLTGTMVLLGILGACGGLIVVPTNALLQWRAPASRRGAVIALSNVFVFAGILAGSLVAGGLSSLGMSAQGILIATAVAALIGTVWAIKLLPQALLRLALVLLTHTLYRLRVVGRARVPTDGGVLLVPNHVSLVDGLFILAAVDRPVRFIVDAGYYQHRFLRPFMKALNALPISTSGGPKQILHAFREAGRALDRGEMVCIFAEGQITRTGMLLPFRRGLERIVKGRKAAVMPVNLDRVWGSLFSHSHGRFVSKIPRKIPYPVTVTFGEPLSSDTPVHVLRRAVHELSQQGWHARKRDMRPLHRTFVRMARWRPFATVFTDAVRGTVSRYKAVTGAIVIARAMRPRWDGTACVGIMLPPSTAGALCNIAAALAGKTVVNLNFTAGSDGMASACRQADLHAVLTSKVFLHKAKLEMPDNVEAIYLEDVAANISGTSKLRAALWPLFPTGSLERSCGARARPRMDDTVTIIFSSGTTGEPKGVLLSHFNVESNVQGIGQVLRFEKTDSMLGVLPLFHSFGYMTMWAIPNLGGAIVFHPNPLDAVAVGELVHHHRVTLLLATPTFLQMYLRRCTPGQFGSLRIVIVGAEKLSPRLAQAFEDHFGLRPLEGYGTTECSPVIAASVPDYRSSGFFQPGSRRGFVGQPLPGVAVRIVDPDTYEPLPPLEPGMLLVLGPNVMQGYLNRPDLTAEVMHEGWYVTGDIAYMDEDGFVRITDRLSRFSKIGGEMVPHGRLEEELHRIVGSEIQVFAVTAVPDERKGEVLVVLHTLDEEQVDEVYEKLRAGDLPNLFVPKRGHFIGIDALPVLGTGKLDLRTAKSLAAEAIAGAG